MGAIGFRLSGLRRLAGESVVGPSDCLWGRSACRAVVGCNLAAFAGRFLRAGA